MIGNFLKSSKEVSAERDPLLLYKKEKHLLNKPFYFQGTNEKAVLLIHGWSTTPYELRRLGLHLNKNGYTVDAPLLSGHGTVPRDLEEISWKKWVKDAEEEYLRLRENYNRVYVGGTSIGASIALVLAKKYPEISGLVLMATPYKLRLESLALFYARTVSFFKKYSRKIYPPTFGSSRTITRLISYQTYPYSSVFQAFEIVKEARRKISRVKQPCLIMQSTSDHVVSGKSADLIYEKIGSKTKKKIYIKRAYHTFIADIKNEHVFKDIVEFIKSIK